MILISALPSSEVRYTVGFTTLEALRILKLIANIGYWFSLVHVRSQIIFAYLS